MASKFSKIKFVIFHGAFGSPEENWFPQLKDQLESLGQTVIVPNFPVEDWDILTAAGSSKLPKKQTLLNWTKTFQKEVLPKIKKTDQLCFVGHSLGPLFILHLVEKFNLQLDSAIFVSPFLEPLKKLWQIDHVNKSFYKNNFNFEKLKKLIPLSYVLYSENDPYVESRFSLHFADQLGSAKILVHRAGHMNLEVNLNEFPLVFELCKTRLDLTLYQKYLAHRRHLYAVDYIKGKHKGEVIYLKPEEVFDEGVFKFRNLKHEGFCTFFTGLSLWDTQSIYYEEARRAAKRIKNFTRVFVVEKKSDLNKKLLQKQIKLDLQSGIKIYIVFWKNLQDIHCEADFGIWDNDYLCMIKMNTRHNPSEILLSSRKQDIARGKQWAKKILKRALPITSIKDLNHFKKMG